jgi:hypothetical protein
MLVRSMQLLRVKSRFLSPQPTTFKDRLSKGGVHGAARSLGDLGHFEDGNAGSWHCNWANEGGGMDDNSRTVLVVVGFLEAVLGGGRLWKNHSLVGTSPPGQDPVNMVFLKPPRFNAIWPLPLMTLHQVTRLSLRISASGVQGNQHRGPGFPR